MLAMTQTKMFVYIFVIFRSMNRSRSYWSLTQSALHKGSLKDTTKNKRFAALSKDKIYEAIIKCQTH